MSLIPENPNDFGDIRDSSGDELISEPMINESPAIVLFEMSKKLPDGGTATFKWTFRAKTGESEYEVFDRAQNFVRRVEKSGEYVHRDPPRYQAKGSGSGSNKSPNIPNNEFGVVSFERFERPNKKDPTKGNWHFLRAYGDVNGQEVYADCFVGSETWQKPGNAVSGWTENDFNGFFGFAAGQRIAPANPMVAKVQLNTQFGGYEIVALA